VLKLDSRIVSLSTARTLDRLVRQLPRWFRFSVGVEIEGASHPIFCRLGGSDLKVGLPTSVWVTLVRLAA
jgi:hypothetical protein